MAKSRIARRAPIPTGAALAWLAAAAAVPAQGQSYPGAAPMTAEEAVARQQARVREIVRQACPQATGPNEVVVCGRRESAQRYRVPSPSPELVASLRETAGGEQLRAMAAGSERCSTVGRAQQCGGGVDLIGIGFTIARLVGQALANRD